jgi:hypothetical protein
MQWETAGEYYVALGLETLPLGLSVRVADNTVYAQIHARTRRI